MRVEMKKRTWLVVASAVTVLAVVALIAVFSTSDPAHTKTQRPAVAGDKLSAATPSTSASPSTVSTRPGKAVAKPSAASSPAAGAVKGQSSTGGQVPGTRSSTSSTEGAVVSGSTGSSRSSGSRPSGTRTSTTSTGGRSSSSGHVSPGGSGSGSSAGSVNGGGSSSSPSSTPTESPAQVASDLLGWINAQRASLGLHPLVETSCLDGFAQPWADQLSRNFNHQNTSTIASTCGYQYATEDIASDFSAVQIESDWRNSSAHWNNIVDPDAIAVGISVSETSWGAIYAVADFGGN